MKFCFARCVILFLLIPCLVQPIYSTTIVDSLLKEYKKTYLSQSKLDILVDLSKAYLETNPDSSLYYATKALEISSHNENSYDNAYVNFRIGCAYDDLQEFENSIKHFTIALKNANGLDSIVLEGMIHHRLGYIYNRQGEFEKSVSSFFKAKSLFERTNRQYELAKTYHHLGMVYNDFNEDEDAISFYNQAIELYKKSGDMESVAAVLQNIGVSYVSLKNDGKAYDYYLLSLAIYDSLSNGYGQALTKINIGDILHSRREFTRSLENLNSAAAYFQNHVCEDELAIIYDNIGQVYLDMGKPDLAIEYFNKGIVLAEKFDYKLDLNDLYLQISKAYEAKADYRASMYYYKKYNELNSSIFKTENFTKINELRARYELEIKATELARKDDKLKIQYLQIVVLIFALIGIVGLAIVLLYILRKKERSRKRLEKHKKELEQLVDVKTRELQIEITERRIAEESDKLKSAFLSNMSHEIRTPMNAIISFSNFLKDPKLNQEKREEYIKHITTAGTSLLRLIDDIIDIAKLEAHQIKIQKAPHNVNRLLKEIYKYYQKSVLPGLEKYIEFKLSLPDNAARCFIETDNLRLSQIISNLIDNSFKYTESGLVEFGYQITGDEQLKFFVKDSGPGIPINKKDKVFDRFTRIELSGSRVYSGTGLGLSIAKELVNLLGGDIWFDSIPNEGTVFYFTHPYNPQGDYDYNEKVVEYDEHLSNVSYNWDDKVILIAEDDDLNFKILETVIDWTRAKVIRAKDGKMALEYSKMHSIDLILLDIQMPEMDGYEVAKKIKQHNFKLPIIAQTSYAMHEEKMKCIDAGCDDYLSKPVDLKELMHKLSKFLG